MWFRQLFDPDSSTYTYVVADEAAGVAAVIDPVRERADELLSLLDGARLRLVLSLETHTHADHVTAASQLRERTGCQLAVEHGANSCACSDLSLRDGDVVPVGALGVRVIATPGHTPDSLSFLVEDRLFTGDALLIGTCGRTDFQGGDPGALYDSLQRLFALPDETLVFPAHDYQGRTHTTIATERWGNARAAGRSRSEFVTLMESLHLPPPKKIAESLPANNRCGLDGTPHGA